MPLQAFITAANQAKTAQELVAVWQEAMAAAGFDCLLFSLLTDHVLIDRKAGHIVAVNFPREWLANYFAHGFELVRQHMFVAKGTFSWQVLSKNKNFPETNMFDLDSRIGLFSGIGIPVRGPCGAFGGVTAASRVQGVTSTRDIYAHVHLLSHHFYTLFLELEHKASGKEDIRLTDRERQVLTWYSLGKSQDEIGCILGVTARVVKFHLDGIFAKLSVHNGRVAVTKAIAMGLITPFFQKNEI